MKIEEDKAGLRYQPGQKRTRPLRVLALGLPRTGTRSMCTALEVLGYTHCAHGFDIMDNPAYVAKLNAAIDAKYHNGKSFTRADWDELLGHCAATTDAPLCLFWRELIEAYPEAKVVLVQRDEDKWYKSFCTSTIDNMFSTSGQFTRKYVEPLLGSNVGGFSMKVLTAMLDAEDEAGMKGNARIVYRKHYEDIRAEVPAEKLLDYELGSGWTPLCNFLDVPVPDQEFPWVNESEALQEKIEEFKKQKLAELQGIVIRRVLPVLVAVAASAYYFWM